MTLKIKCGSGDRTTVRGETCENLAEQTVYCEHGIASLFLVAL